ncbi:MAG: hypothetical protein J1F25_06220 [Prevotellaceae bacterium]|nr:hypothetical protein [Prevotellaceae bacterium]
MGDDEICRLRSVGARIRFKAEMDGISIRVLFSRNDEKLPILRMLRICKMALCVPFWKTFHLCKNCKHLKINNLIFQNGKLYIEGENFVCFILPIQKTLVDLQRNSSRTLFGAPRCPSLTAMTGGQIPSAACE